MTPPPSTGDPVRDAENMRSFANQYPAQRLQSGTPGSMSLGVQTMDPGQNLPLPTAGGPSSPYAFMGMAGDQSNSFEREQGQNPFQFDPAYRGQNVPDWMINNPNFDPMVPVAMVHAEYMNPATGETFNQTGDRYMVDPSLKGDFVNNTLLSGDHLPSSQGGNNLLGANLSSGIFGASPPPNSSSPTSLAPLNREGFMQTQQPEMRGFDERHREQHSQMGNGGGYSPMGGGLMDLASAQSNYGSSPFMAPASGSSGYQTGSPFGSMPSPFGGGLSRGYYT